MHKLLDVIIADEVAHFTRKLPRGVRNPVFITEGKDSKIDTGRIILELRRNETINRIIKMEDIEGPPLSSPKLPLSGKMLTAGRLPAIPTHDEPVVRAALREMFHDFLMISLNPR